MRCAPLLVFAACGRIGFDPLAGHDEDGTHSGSRLKIIWDRYEGDTYKMRSIYDSVLDEECYAFSDLVTWRCEPQVMPLGYADAACTQPLAVQSTCGVRRKFTRDFAGTRYTVGALSTATSYYDMQGSCNGPYGAVALYDVAEVVPDEALAAIEVVEQPVSRLTQRWFESEGFRAPHTPLDTVLATECIPTLEEDHGVCNPTGSRFAQYAADPGCTQKLVGSFDTYAPPFAYHQGAANCFDIFGSFFTTGAEVTPTTLYVQSGVGCQVTPGPPGVHYYPTATSVAPAVLSSSRIPRRRIEVGVFDSAGIAYRSNALFDRELGIECQPKQAADGQRRCLPREIPSTLLFTDATCTTQATYYYTFDISGCTPSTAPPYVTVAPTNCGDPVHVFETQPTSTPYVTGCVPYPNAGGATYHWFSPGAPVAPSVFAAAEQITDP